MKIECNYDKQNSELRLNALNIVYGNYEEKDQNCLKDYKELYSYIDEVVKLKGKIIWSYRDFSTQKNELFEFSFPMEIENDKNLLYYIPSILVMMRLQCLHEGMEEIFASFDENYTEHLKPLLEEIIGDTSNVDPEKYNFSRWKIKTEHTSGSLMGAIK